MTTGGARGRSRSTGDSPSSRTCSPYITSSSPSREATAGLTCRRVLHRGRHGWMVAPGFLTELRCHVFGWCFSSKNPPKIYRSALITWWKQLTEYLMFMINQFQVVQIHIFIFSSV